MKKTVLVFSALIIAILVLFQIGQYSIISNDLKIESAIAVVALVFFFIGVYLNKASLQKKNNINDEIDFNKIKKLDISNREYEVLELISKGLSNKEIASELFLSESTIKSHVSNLLLKLNAKRRTQAVQIAKEFHIL